MKKKLIMLSLSALFIATSASRIQSAESYLDLKPVDQVKARVTDDLKSKKPENITLKAYNKPLSEDAKINQRDLIFKYREEAMSDPNYVENPKKEIYGQGEDITKKTTEEEIKEEEIKTTEKEIEIEKENTSETKTAIQVVNTENKNIQKTQAKKPAPKNNFVPNSITFNGNSVKFQPSAFNYFENEDASWDELDRRFDVVTKEIRGKNVSLGPAFSGTDGQATYILGHNPGTMSKIARLKIGDVFQVTDRAGNTFSYKVVDHANTSKSYDFVNGHGYGGEPFYYGWDSESVFIQYCINGESQVYMGIPTN